MLLVALDESAAEQHDAIAVVQLESRQILSWIDHRRGE